MMTTRRPDGPKSTSQIFRWPIFIAAASIVGLVAALVGDGWYDILSWLLLGGTAAAIVHLLTTDRD